jgi:hypothetical protein
MKINPKFVSDNVTTDDELVTNVNKMVGDLGEYLVKGSRAFTATDVTNGYFELKYTVVPFSLKLYKGRMRLHETIDYTVSTVGEVSRITLIGSVASGGEEEIIDGDEVFYVYKYSYGDIMAAYKQHFKEIDADDISNNYVDLPHLAKSNSIVSCVGRLGMFEAIDYDTTVVNGKTRVTFKGDMLPEGSTPLAVGNVVVFNYQL